MHDDSMNPATPHSGDNLDALITHALERAPQPHIPADFTARVTGNLPQRKRALPAVALPRARYGRIMAVASLIVLLIALIMLAPSAMQGSAIAIQLEWILCVQFALVGAWIGSSSVRAFFRSPL